MAERKQHKIELIEAQRKSEEKAKKKLVFFILTDRRCLLKRNSIEFSKEVTLKTMKKMILSILQFSNSSHTMYSSPKTPQVVKIQKRDRPKHKLYKNREISGVLSKQTLQGKFLTMRS